MTLRDKRKVVLVKLEDTYGVDPIPDPQVDAVLLQSVSVSDPLTAASASRTIVRPFLGSYATLLAGPFAKIEISLEVAGFGAAGPAAPTPAYDALLQSCALASTLTPGANVTYTPVSDGMVSVTCYVYIDGVVHKITGCRGDLDTGLSDAGIPVHKITLTGLYQDVADEALPTPNVSAYQTPLIVCSDYTQAVTVYGFAAAVKDFSFKLGNSVETREYPGGAKQVLITDRSSSGSIEMEAQLVATFDPWTLIKTSAPGPISLTHGIAPGNLVTFNVPTAVPKNAKYTQDQNIVNVSFDLDATPTGAGNNEFSLVIA